MPNEPEALAHVRTGPKTAGPSYAPLYSPEEYALVDPAWLEGRDPLGHDIVVRLDQRMAFRDGEQSPDTQWREAYFPIFTDPYNNSHWGLRQQQIFEAATTGESVDLMMATADAVGYNWPDVFQARLQEELSHQLKVYQYLVEYEGFHPEERERLTAKGALREGVSLHFMHASLSWGVYHLLRKRYKWRSPWIRACTLCQRHYWEAEVPRWAVRNWNTTRWCRECCHRIRGFVENESPVKWTKRAALDKVMELSRHLGTTPIAGDWHLTFQASSSTDRQDEWALLLQSMPTLEKVQELVGSTKWLAILQAAGLAGKVSAPRRAL